MERAGRLGLPFCWRGPCTESPAASETARQPEVSAPRRGDHLALQLVKQATPATNSEKREAF